MPKKNPILPHSKRSSEIPSRSPLIETISGKKWLIEPPTEGPQGPYDDITFYGDLSHLQGEIPAHLRWNAYNLKEGRNIGAKLPQIRDAMHSITNLVARVGSVPQTIDHQLEYQQTIMPVFKACTEELLRLFERKYPDLFQTNNYAIMPPLNGGEFTAAALVYNAEKLGLQIPLEKIARFELKRLTLQDGTMLLGQRVHYLPPIEPDTVIIVPDDCVASYVSADRSISIAKEQVSSSELDKLPPPVVMVAAGNQAGLENLVKIHSAIPLVGIVNYALDSNYYLRRTVLENYPNKDFTVGSMGDFFARLTEAYDQYAPWNIIRRRLAAFWQSL